MDLLSELRHPTRWYFQLIAALLAVALFAALISLIVAGGVVYRTVTPPRSAGQISIASLPGRPQDFSYIVEGGSAREAWFFPGLRSAPTLVLCPSFGSNRAELLPLATALQNNQYNVLLVDFPGHGPNAGRSTLGFREVQELRAAISAVAQRDDVDPSRFGVWGTDLGAYVALGVAASDPRVQAVAVESVYDRPEDLARLLIARDGLAPLSPLRRLAERGFFWLNYRYRETPPLSARLERLAGVPKLFIEAADQPGLGALTRDLFAAAPEPKELVTLPRGGYAGMLNEEKREYESRLISFFLLNLPPSPRGRR